MLQNLIRERGLKVDYVAKKVGITKSCIYKYFEDVKWMQNMSVSKAIKLAEVLNVTVEEWISEKENPLYKIEKQAWNFLFKYFGEENINELSLIKNIVITENFKDSLPYHIFTQNKKLFEKIEPKFYALTEFDCYVLYKKIKEDD